MMVLYGRASRLGGEREAFFMETLGFVLTVLGSVAFIGAPVMAVVQRVRGKAAKPWLWGWLGSFVTALLAWISTEPSLDNA
jgi:hypothetical protein